MQSGGYYLVIHINTHAWSLDPKEIPILRRGGADLNFVFFFFFDILCFYIIK